MFQGNIVSDPNISSVKVGGLQGISDLRKAVNPVRMGKQSPFVPTVAVLIGRAQSKISKKKYGPFPKLKEDSVGNHISSDRNNHPTIWSIRRRTHG